jgi:hypothetical protein
MSEQNNLFEGGLEKHSFKRILISNLLVIIWFILGAFACWFFYPILGIVYLIAAFVLVYVVLRKLVCVNCYYYDKWCGIGFGKLSAIMFKKGKIEAFPTSTGMKIAPTTYGLLVIVPLILLIVSIIQDFSWYKTIVFILLLLVSVYIFGIGRKKYLCSQCKMNIVCPGSAVNKKKE